MEQSTMKKILYNPTPNELTQKINAAAGLQGINNPHGTILFEIKADATTGKSTDIFALDGFFLAARKKNGSFIDRVQLAHFVTAIPGYLYPVTVRYALNTRMLGRADLNKIRDFRSSDCGEFLIDMEGIATVLVTCPNALDSVLTLLTELDATAVLYSQMLARLDGSAF